MQLADTEEIIACLPEGRTPFWYFRDRYALLLLSFLGDAVEKRTLKRSPFAQLLDKSVVKDVFAEHRGKAVPREAFETHVAASPECYSLTLGTWGSNEHNTFVQTTRRGYNLVLQLNFPAEHNQAYRRLVDPAGVMLFESCIHPVAESRDTTLAWSRLDIDLESGEALIEEIQSDWLRFAEPYRRHALYGDKALLFWEPQTSPEDVARYFQEELPKYSHWEETMLAASIWFLHRELGISTIYYHTFESGAAIKRTGWAKPPRSVYTRLPRRFCFRESQTRPAFMRSSLRTSYPKKTVRNAQFYRLAL